jgi:DnaD/phage-associated family protein
MSNARFSILQARAVKDKRITDSQFRTLAALGMYADENGWCFPSLATLGSDLSKSKQSVGRDTIALRKLGYLQVTARYNKQTGARRSSLYRLRFDLPPVNMDDSTPSTSEVDTPSTSEVDVNDPVNDPNKIEIGAIFEALEGLGGGLNSSVTRYVDAWVEKHPIEWILKAIEETKERGATSEKYTDKILINWEANGYPKTRDERVQAAKSNGKHAQPAEPVGVSVSRSWLEKKQKENINHG